MSENKLFLPYLNFLAFLAVHFPSEIRKLLQAPEQLRAALADYAVDPQTFAPKEAAPDSEDAAEGATMDGQNADAAETMWRWLQTPERERLVALVKEQFSADQIDLEDLNRMFGPPQDPNQPPADLTVET